MPGPLASIAITTYNRERYILQCLESALNQTYRPVEVVVVDDGSSDATRRLLEPYRNRVRICYHDRNLGIAAAKNQALRLTSPAARYVALLDSDDRFHPRFVERCADFLAQNPKIGLVYADDVLVDENGRELRKRHALEPWSFDAWLRTGEVRGDAWLALRELVMRTRLHAEALTRAADFDLLCQMAEITPFGHVTAPLVYIRQHPGQASDGKELIRCLAAVMVRYGYSAEYAYLRARRNPELVPAIEAGIALGTLLRDGV